MYLTCCDYFLKIYLRATVYHESPNKISELKSKTTQANANIDKDTLRKVYNSKNGLCFILREGMVISNNS